MRFEIFGPMVSISPIVPSEVETVMKIAEIIGNNQGPQQYKLISLGNNSWT